VSLVSTGTLGPWDRRRFRANVLLDGEGEDAFVGTSIAIADVRLDVQKRIDRCVIITRPQPGEIERDLDVLRVVNREREGRLAIGALVARGGTMGVGDEVVPDQCAVPRAGVGAVRGAGVGGCGEGEVGEAAGHDRDAQPAARPVLPGGD
jgi:hypothetical protein